MNFLIGVACVAAVVVAFCAVAIVNRLNQLIGIITGARERTDLEDGLKSALRDLTASAPLTSERRPAEAGARNRCLRRLPCVSARVRLKAVEPLICVDDHAL